MSLNNITAGDGIIVRRTAVDAVAVALDPSIQSSIAELQAREGFDDADLQAQIEALKKQIAALSATTSQIAGSIPDAIPAGLIALWSGLLADIPTGWVLCDGTNGTPDLRDKFIKGSAAGIDPGVTGGSNTHTHDDHNYTPTGTVSTPSFTGTPDNTSADSAGTPAGTVSQPTFTGTPGATSSDSAGTPAGSVSAPTFTGTPASTSSDSAGTPAGTVSQPTFTGDALATHSHGVGTYANTAITAGTPAGTIAWPAGVPTAANESAHTHSVTSNVSVDNHASHTHTYTEVPNHVHVQNMQSAQTGPLQGWAAGDASTNTPIATGYSTANPTGGVATGTTAGPSATLTHTVNNPAVTSGAGSAHTHVLSWPAGVPTFAGSALATHNHVFSGTSEAVSGGTPSGTVSQPTFTGSALANHSHTYTPAGTNSAPTFTGSALAAHDHDFTPVGTVSQPTFAGDPLAAHDHSFTPAGTVSQPTFTGALDPLAHSVANNEPEYYSLAFIMKT